MKRKPTKWEKIFARSDQQGINIQNIQFIQPNIFLKLIKNEWEI